MQLKYCVNPQQFITCITSGFIANVTLFDETTDEQLPTYLYSEADQPNDVKNVEELEPVQMQHKMNMENKNVRSQMKDLFANYYCILSQQDVRWIVEENKKRAVTHVLSAIHSPSLRERLLSNLSFSHNELKTTSKCFLRMQWKFQKLLKLWKMVWKERWKRMTGIALETLKGLTKAMKRIWIRVASSVSMEASSQKSIRHFVLHYNECPEDEKSRLCEQMPAKKT